MATLDAVGWIWFGSALVIIVAGLALLGVRTRLSAGGSLAVFLAGWGVQMLFSAYARDAFNSGGDARLFVELSIATLMLLYIPLLQFTWGYTARADRPVSGLARGLLLPLPGLAGLAALFVAPAAVVQVGPGGASWGPVALAHFVLFLGSLLYLLVALYRHQAQATARIEVRRTVNALLALLVFVAFIGAQNAVYHGRLFLVGGHTGWSAVADAALSLLGVVTLAVVSAVAASLVLHPRLGARKPSPLALPAVLVPAGLGTAVGLTDIPALFITPVDGLGLWRAFSVVLLVWTILHYERWNLGEQAKRVGVAAGLLAAAMFPVVLFYHLAGLLTFLDGRLILAVPLAMVLGGAVLFARTRVVAKVAGRLPGGKPEQLDDRRVEVYEATLARLHEEGRLESDAEFLAQLRAGLGISEREHLLLLRLVTLPGAAQEERHDLRPGTLVAGRYLLQDLLGEGAEGSAYLARDERLGRGVVVKVLSSYQDMTQKAVHRFLREARIAAEHNHPNVVRIYDFGYYGVRPYLVMEHAEGGSLADLLTGQQGLPPERCESILDDVLSGLAHIHEHRVLHRDLKPGNILFNAEGTAMITDFGLAHHIDAEAVRGGLDNFETPGGTPAYMSPESAKGAQLLPQSDLYSVGALLYHMLTGRTYLPLEGRSHADMKWMILHEQPVLPEDVDPVLGHVALRALSKDPDERFATAEEMRQALHGGTFGHSQPALPLAHGMN